MTVSTCLEGTLSHRCHLPSAISDWVPRPMASLLAPSPSSTPFFIRSAALGGATQWVRLFQKPLSNHSGQKWGNTLFEGKTVSRVSIRRKWGVCGRVAAQP